MTTEKNDVIELPADPFERASQALSAQEALKQPMTAAILALEKLDPLFGAAANAVDASRGITIRIGAQMREVSHGVAEVARDHAELVSQFRRWREECYRFADTLRTVRDSLPDTRGEKDTVPA